MTRNYIPNVAEHNKRKCRLLPWIPCDMKNTDYTQTEPDQSFFQVVKIYTRLESILECSCGHYVLINLKGIVWTLLLFIVTVWEHSDHKIGTL